MEVGTELLRASWSSQEPHTTLRLARELANGWRRRVLSHAEAEEQDVFPRVIERLPELRPVVTALIRDHELMRLLVDEAERELGREGQVTAAVMDRFTALLHVQRLHSAFEEETFLPQVSGSLTREAQPSEGAADS